MFAAVWDIALLQESMIPIAHSIGWALLAAAVFGFGMMLVTMPLIRDAWEHMCEEKLTQKQVDRILAAYTKVNWTIAVGAGLIAFLLTV